VSKRSRGLLRDDNNTCFLLGGLQTLFHLPGFQNWILSHNSREGGTVNFPCRSFKDINAALVLNYELEKCPACVVKQFLGEYWGEFDINVTTGHPHAHPHLHARMVELCDLGDIIKSMTFGADGADGQEDAREFQDRLL
jgi:hypothetical protein